MSHYVFEGLDGVGKTSVIRLVQEHLKSGGIKAEVSSGYEGSRAASKLRHALIEERFTPLGEALTFFASHVQHASEVVLPMLDAGTTVLQDRSYFTTLAYQGHFDGTFLVYDIVKPHLPVPTKVLLLDAPYEVRKQRLGKARAPDVFESRERQFFDETEARYKELAKEHQFEVIDASADLESVVASCIAAIQR